MMGMIQHAYRCINDDCPAVWWLAYEKTMTEALKPPFECPRCTHIMEYFGHGEAERAQWPAIFDLARDIRDMVTEPSP